jgi:hypothetical protein
MKGGKGAELIKLFVHGANMAIPARRARLRDKN